MNNDSKISNKNILFSKALKDIDSRINFKINHGNKYAVKINEFKKAQKEKELLINNYKQHQDIINKLILKEEEKNKSKLTHNNSAINIQNFNNLYLPKIQTSIGNNHKDNSVSMGFEKIWKEEIFRNGIKVHNMNIKGKLNKSKTNDNTQDYIIDIFDQNYNKCLILNHFLLYHLKKFHNIQNLFLLIEMSLNFLNQIKKYVLIIKF